MKLSHHSKLWNLDQSTEVYFTMFPPQHENGQVRKKKTIYVRYAGTLEESVISNIHYSKWYSHSKDFKQHKYSLKMALLGLITP